MSDKKAGGNGPETSGYSVTHSDAWIAAIERGKKYAASCLNDAENVDITTASELLKVDTSSLLKQIDDGHLYGFSPDNDRSDVRIPAWQLQGNTSRIRQALSLFIGKGIDPFYIHSFFLRNYEDLDGLTGRDAVLGDKFDIDFACLILSRAIPGEQGAR